jgi:hypothetical protein
MSASDFEKARNLGPVRRGCALGNNVTLSATTSPAHSDSALNTFVERYASFWADGGNVGITFASAAGSTTYAQCAFKIPDGGSEPVDLYISQADADLGLVYITDSGTPTLYIGKPEES